MRFILESLRYWPFWYSISHKHAHGFVLLCWGCVNLYGIVVDLSIYFQVASLNTLAITTIFFSVNEITLKNMGKIDQYKTTWTVCRGTRTWHLGACRWLATSSHTLIARFMGPTWGHLGPTGPRWAPCWPHELCYLGSDDRKMSFVISRNFEYQLMHQWTPWLM